MSKMKTKKCVFFLAIDNLSMVEKARKGEERLVPAHQRLSLENVAGFGV